MDEQRPDDYDDADTYATPYPQSPPPARTPEPDARGWASPPTANGWGAPPPQQGWANAATPQRPTNGWAAPPPQAESGWGPPPTGNGWGAETPPATPQAQDDDEPYPSVRRAASTSSDDDEEFEADLDDFFKDEGDGGYRHLLDVARGATHRLPCPLRCHAYATLRVPRCVSCGAKPFVGGTFTERLRKLAAHAQSKADGTEQAHRAHRKLLRWLKRRYASILGDVPEPPSETALVDAASNEDASEGEEGALVVVAPTDKAWPEDVPLRCEPEIQGQPWALLALMAGETRDAVQAKLEDINADDPFASLVDIKLSLGRRPRLKLRERVVEVQGPLTSREDIRAACAPLSFDSMQRAALPNELHRISRVAMADGTVTALVLRVGRTVRGASHRVADLIAAGKSILFLGAPGAGKSTALRDAASSA